MTDLRAYATFVTKALDEDKREISGIASTPETDRAGDIVEPLGAKFASEIPFLWQHDRGEPVGWAKLKATKQAIEFTASLAKIDEDGPLKAVLDKAWQSIKAKLVRGVSIGFRPIEYSFMEGGGVHYKEIEIYELSAVTIPAHQGAGIATIKAYAQNRIKLIPAPVHERGAGSGIRLITSVSPKTIQIINSGT